MNIAKQRYESRLKRQVRVRKKVRGTASRPRLSIFRSAKHIYAQIIDDVTGSTLAAASTAEKSIASSLKSTGGVEAAVAVGKAIGAKALAANIASVVFDRNGFLYHGRVKALADAAREAGLNF